VKKDDSFFRYVRGFLTIFLPKNKCFSQNTVKAYRDALNLFRKFLLEKKGIAFTQISFDLINHEVIYEFLVWLQDTHGCGASTQNHRLAVLKSFLRYCAFEDPALMAIYLDIQKVQPHKTPKKRVEYMSETALKVLLEQPDPDTRCGLRNRFLMILLYDTGARIQEILDLKLKDLHLKDQTPCIYLTGKGDKTRAVPVMDKTIAHLQEYLRAFHPDGDLKDDQYLFYTLIKGRCRRIMFLVSSNGMPNPPTKYARKCRYECTPIYSGIRGQCTCIRRAFRSPTSKTSSAMPV
jgi:integrase/recombinase XerD